MRYIKPHLSPELRAQITPHKRRDVKLASAGVIFLALSIILAINLRPARKATTSNNKPVANITQSEDSGQEKRVLGLATEASPASFTQYMVKNGDTLFNISQQYNIRWDLISEVNGLKEPYILHAGQVLKIPQATTSKVANKVYTIKSGDTLVSIARLYNITVDDIIAVNPNLQKSDLITVGQIIKLP